MRLCRLRFQSVHNVLSLWFGQYNCSGKMTMVDLLTPRA